MSATANARDLGDAPAVLPIDRELANWLGKIAVAAKKDSGLDSFKSALDWAKQNVPPDNGLCEKAKQEIRETAERHLGTVHTPAVLEAIYFATFPEDAMSEDDLDALTNKNDRANEIERLAKLGNIEYALERKTIASKLGIGVGALDAARKAAREENGDTKGQGRPIEMVQVEPWAEPVDGAALLTDLSLTLQKYVVVTDVQADAIALWNLHTHAHDASDVSPKLVLKSAQKRSGKTRLAAALARTVALPFYVSGIKPAALLRIIETEAPTLLLDEMDAAMKQDREMAEALRGIIDSGFDRAGARYIMNVPRRGGGFEPRQFSTWAPQLLSGIGDLPDTVRDRSIEIEMIRKRREEKVTRLRRRDGDDLDVLGRKSARWGHDNLEILRDAMPEIPSGLSDRAADAWETLFAIADRAGGDWPQRARKAALTLSGEHVKEDDNIATQLFVDIRAVFTTEQIKSEKLVELLVAIEGHPWAEFGHIGKPITQNKLARLLKPYNIRPGTIRTGAGQKDTAKGYKSAQFADVFERYLPDPLIQTVTPSQTNNDGDFDPLQTVTPHVDVTLPSPSQFNNDGHCDGVTVSSPHLWEEEL
jgi:putative DNA primase/helicase